MANEFITGIVKDISLKDNNDGLLNAIGVYTSNMPNKLIVALPYDSNIKRIPLIGEAVLLIQSHSGTSKPEQKSSDTQYYYLNPISLQNSIHNNALPGSKTVVITDKNSEYSAVTAGNPNTSVKNDTVNLGKGFVEKSGINQVQPFIGDVIFEGRFGQSLRFGYTPKQSDTTHRPNWKSSNVTDPLTILSNGRSSSGVPNKYIIEDVNDDKSSIWLTTSQLIPIKTVQPFPTGVLPQKSFDKPTLIFNSDRILLNSKSDNILLTSSKTVGISTKKWKVDMDKMFTIIESLVQQISDLTSGKATFATGTGPTGPATNMVQITKLLTELKQMSQ